MQYLKRLKRKRKIEESESGKKHISAKTPYLRTSIKQLLPWMGVVGVVVVVILFLKLPFFKIDEIECSYFEAESCPEEVLSELSKLQGNHIFLIDTKDVQTKLTKAITQAKEIELKKELPRKVIVGFVPHQNFAYFQAESGSQALVLSKELVITSAADTTDEELPVIIYPEAHLYSIGDMVNTAEVMFASKLASLLQSEYVEFSSITVVDHELLVVNLDDGRVAYFSAAVDTEAQVKSLIKVLTKLELEDTNQIIDVRFDQPVIKSE